MFFVLFIYVYIEGVVCIWGACVCMHESVCTWKHVPVGVCICLCVHTWMLCVGCVWGLWTYTHTCVWAWACVPVGVCACVCVYSGGYVEEYRRGWRVCVHVCVCMCMCGTSILLEIEPRASCVLAKFSNSGLHFYPSYLFILRRGHTKTHRLALNSFCNSGKPWIYNPPISASSGVKIKSLLPGLASIWYQTYRW